MRLICKLELNAFTAAETIAVKAFVMGSLLGSEASFETLGSKEAFTVMNICEAVNYELSITPSVANKVIVPAAHRPIVDNAKSLIAAIRGYENKTPQIVNGF